MHSFWEKNTLLNYDTAIIGAGIVGLSIASAILEKYPKQRVIVLERGLLPMGASTRNAGFACFGSLTELLADEAKMGTDKCLELVERRWNGLQKLVKRLGKKNIDFQNWGGYEILPTQDYQEVREDMLRYNALLQAIFPTAVYSDSSHKIPEFGFQKVRTMLHNRYEAQIDTGKMMDNLWLYAQKKGAKILTGAEVAHFQENSQGVEIELQDKTRLTASQLIVCTNAFASKFFPEIEISPGRGQVLITKPLPAPLKFKGTFHLDEGFYYFRNFENRVLLGGGRNLDFEAETTTDFGLTDLIQNDLIQKLQNIILPTQKFEVEMAWAGIMAFSKDKQPICEKITPHTWLVARLNGMGVALASQLADELVQKF